MGSDVQQGGLRPSLKQNFRGGLLPEVEFGLWQQSCNRLRLGDNLRRPIVRDSKNEGTLFVGRSLLHAEGKDRRAWRVRHCVSIPHVFVAISQSMERKKVQCPMRHYDQALLTKPGTQWPY